MNLQTESVSVFLFEKLFNVRPTDGGLYACELLFSDPSGVRKKMAMSCDVSEGRRIQNLVGKMVSVTFFNGTADTSDPVVKNIEEATPVGNMTASQAQENQADGGSQGNTDKSEAITPVFSDLKSEAEVGRLKAKTRMILLLKSVEEKTASNGPYCRLKLSDKARVEVTANAFSCTEDKFLPYKGKLVSVVVSKGEYKGVTSFTIETASVKPAPDTADIASFVACAPEPVESMYQSITDELARIAASGRPAAVLAAAVYADNRDQILKSSAAVSVHHTYRGGLLYHTISVMRAADTLCKTIYKDLDRDLIVTASAVHDIGKIQELDTDDAGTAMFTIDGSLQGHIILGIEMLTEAAVKHDLEHPESQVMGTEDYRLLLHMVISHHGSAEWGSAKVPMTPEAVMLHFLDNLDSKINLCQNNLADKKPGTLTDKLFAMGTKLYKPDFITN